MTLLERARRLAGHAALLLGWRPDEFWAATPEELACAFEAALPTDAPFLPASTPLDRTTLLKMQEMNPDG